MGIEIATGSEEHIWDTLGNINPSVVFDVSSDSQVGPARAVFRAISRRLLEMVFAYMLYEVVAQKRQESARTPRLSCQSLYTYYIRRARNTRTSDDDKLRFCASPSPPLLGMQHCREQAQGEKGGRLAGTAETAFRSGRPAGSRSCQPQN
ncbi:hypothetical protein MTO96_004367 [Rhipicephalus appendiculatus]